MDDSFRLNLTVNELVDSLLGSFAYLDLLFKLVLWVDCMSTAWAVTEQSRQLTPLSRDCLRCINLKSAIKYTNG